MNTTTKVKREPTLADRVLAVRAARMRDTSWIEERQSRLVHAKKFVLDAQAAVYVARMLREHPRIVSDANDFAQRPFERMWIELPFKGFFHTITGGRVPDAQSDQVVGYLFDGPVVNVASLGAYRERDNDGKVEPLTSGFTPCEYVLNKPMSVEEERALCEVLGVSRLGIDLQLWGESAHAFNPNDETTMRTPWVGEEQVNREWDREGLRSLRASHTMRIRPIPGVPADKMRHAAEGSAGDLRNIIALLLFLNRTQDIQNVREEGMAHAMIDRRPRPLMPHKVISLRIDPMPRLRKLVANHDHIHRRLHDVRGHYCHDKKARAGCPHGIELRGDFGEAWTEYEPLRWRCQDCGGKRWWRAEHSRGSAEVGVVAHDYAVTAHRSSVDL